MSAGWDNYPVSGGTKELNEAYAKWLVRKSGGAPAEQLGQLAYEPTPGTKQAVSELIRITVECTRWKNKLAPIVLLPTPFYPAYAAATHSSHARPIFYDSTSEDYCDSIIEITLQHPGSIAAVVLCHPSSPRIRQLTVTELEMIAAEAFRGSFHLIIDECYLDLYSPELVKSALFCADSRGRQLRNVVVLHSLSKRSSAPGLRSGFVVGDPSIVRRYARRNRETGVSTPQAICAAAAALWSDDFHVDVTREKLCRNWEIAARQLGKWLNPSDQTAGLFLWLPVIDEEAAAKSLWRESGVKAIPLSYFKCQAFDGDRSSRTALRMALCHEPIVMEEILKRVRLWLEQHGEAR